MWYRIVYRFEPNGTSLSYISGSSLQEFTWDNDKTKSQWLVKWKLKAKHKKFQSILIYNTNTHTHTHTDTNTRHLLCSVNVFHLCEKFGMRLLRKKTKKHFHKKWLIGLICNYKSIFIYLYYMCMWVGSLPYCTLHYKV